MGSERLDKEKLLKQFLLFETGLTDAKADSVRRKFVRDWKAHEPCPSPGPKPPIEEPFDLPAFASTVRALSASSPPEDRFHDNKVFIVALWRASQRESNFPHLTLPEFKQRLLESNTRTCFT